jgi:hypothetical protein
MEDMLAGLRELLAGELGHLDAGTLSTELCAFASANNLKYPS